MVRPSSDAATMVAKLSSKMTISAASFETSVPVMLIATPISACLSAGASLTPSPVIATISPTSLSARTIRSLCSGETRAYTDTSFTTLRRSSSLICCRSLPMSVLALSPTIPRSRAIALAVIGWSPVIITTRMPAVLQVATASFTSGRGGSIMPTNPMNTLSFSASDHSSLAGSASSGLNAMPSTRRPSFASLALSFSMRSTNCGVISLISP